MAVSLSMDNREAGDKEMCVYARVCRSVSGCVRETTTQTFLCLSF